MIELTSILKSTIPPATDVSLMTNHVCMSNVIHAYILSTKCVLHAGLLCKLVCVMNIYARACVPVCMRACVCACACVRVCVHVCESLCV